MIPIVEEAAIRRVITPQVAVDAMREAFRADGEGRAHVPPVINLDVPAHHGEFHVKTALVDGVPHVAVKIASGFYDNPRRGCRADRASWRCSTRPRGSRSRCSSTTVS